MGNIKVLQGSKTPEDCGCGGSGSGGSGGAQFVDPLTRFTVRHAPGCEIGNVINTYNENGKKIYELNDLALIAPSVTFSNDAGTREVGETVAIVVFSGSIVAETFPIVSRLIVPDPGGLDLTAPFTFQKTNVKRTTPGVLHTHTLTAVDDQGNTVNKVSEVPFKDAFFQGFNAAAVLNQTQIKALANKHLIDSILQQYGGLRSYTVPGPDAKYIYWVGPIGSPIIGSASLNGFFLPLLDVGPIAVTNPHDGTLNVSYWVKRTANKVDPGTYTQLALS
jgi:hypothetical protein